MNRYTLLSFFFLSHLAQAQVLLNTCQECTVDQKKSVLEKTTNDTFKGFTFMSGLSGATNSNACLPGESDASLSMIKKSCGLYSAKALRAFGQGNDCYRPRETNDDVTPGELWVGPSNQAFRVVTVEKDPFRIDEKWAENTFKVPTPTTNESLNRSIKTWCNDATADTGKFKISVVQLKNKIVQDKDAKSVIPAIGSATGHGSWVTYLLERAHDVCMRKVQGYVSEGQERSPSNVDVIPESATNNGFLAFAVDHSRPGCSFEVMNCGQGARK